MIALNWTSLVSKVNEKNDPNITSFQSCRDQSDSFRNNYLGILVIQDIVFAMYIINEIIFSVIILKLFISRLVKLITSESSVSSTKVCCFAHLSMKVYIQSIHQHTLRMQTIHPTQINLILYIIQSIICRITCRLQTVDVSIVSIVSAVYAQMIMLMALIWKFLSKLQI